jgi:hypothetical protein
MSLVTRKINFDDYLTLCQGIESQWLYHGAGWLTAVRDGFGANIYALLTESQNDMVAVTPIMSIRKGFITIVGSPMRGMYTEFLGPLFFGEVNDSIKRETIISQNKFLLSIGSAYIGWGAKGFESNNFMKELDRLRYVYSARQTLIIDLRQGINKVWDQFESRARNMVRKAEKNGVVIRNVIPNGSDVDKYYDMLAVTFERRGMRPPHPRSFFQAVCKNLAPANQMLFLMAEKDEAILAGAIFLCDGDRMVYMSGASNEKGFRLAANSLIQWVAMQFAVESGIGEYDLGGVGNADIDKFKASFGGIQHHHHQWVYRTFPIKMAEATYSWLSKKGWVGLHR